MNSFSTTTSRAVSPTTSIPLANDSMKFVRKGFFNREINSIDESLNDTECSGLEVSKDDDNNAGDKVEINCATNKINRRFSRDLRSFSTTD